MLATVFFVDKAYSQESDFSKCEAEVAAEKLAIYSADPQLFAREFCGFYNKPVNECLKIYNESSDAEQQKMIVYYMRTKFVYPKCGRP